MRDSNRFQNGSLTLVKNKRADDSWFFRYYEDLGGKRVHRNLRIGTVRELLRRRDAEKAVLSLRSSINSGVRAPETVRDLVAHYRKHELTMERKAYATVEAHESYLTLHILPKWQDYRLSEVKTVAVEEWLESLELAPATKTKLRNIMSAVYSHGIRHEWISFNPISKVRCSAKRLREPDVLTPGEFQALLRELPLRERVMVMIAGSTGLRRSELFALSGVMSISSQWRLPSPDHACETTSETQRRRQVASQSRCMSQSVMSWQNGGEHHCTKVMTIFFSLLSG